MRNFVLSALAVVSLAGCNQGVPRLWRIAYDDSPIHTITDASCYLDKDPMRHLSGETATNYRVETQWVIWDGDTSQDGKLKQYLDIGTVSFTLADAPRIDVTDIIEGNSSDKEFTGQKVVNRTIPGLRASENRVMQIGVKWNDYGNAPTGSIRLDARYQCNAGLDPCPTQAAATSCTAQLTFVGRRIESTPMTAYPNHGG